MLHAAAPGSCSCMMNGKAQVVGHAAGMFHTLNSRQSLMALTSLQPELGRAAGSRIRYGLYSWDVAPHGDNPTPGCWATLRTARAKHVAARRVTHAKLMKQLAHAMCQTCPSTWVRGRLAVFSRSHCCHTREWSSRHGRLVGSGVLPLDTAIHACT